MRRFSGLLAVVAVGVAANATTAAAATLSLGLLREPAIQGRWPGITATLTGDESEPADGYDVYVKTRPAAGAVCAATPSADPGTTEDTFMGAPALPEGATTSPLLDDPLPVGSQLLCGWMEAADAGPSAPPVATASRVLEVVPARISMAIHVQGTVPALVPFEYEKWPPVTVDWASNTPGELFVADLAPGHDACPSSAAHLASAALTLSGSGGRVFEAIGPASVDIDRPTSGTFKATDQFDRTGVHRVCAWVQQIRRVEDEQGDPAATPVLAGPVEAKVYKQPLFLFRGRTTQHRVIGFQVGGRRVVHLGTIVDQRCTSGLRHIFPSIGFRDVRLGPDGTGHSRYEGTRVSITVHGRRATGTLRLRNRSCTSGLVHFTARRVGVR